MLSTDLVKHSVPTHVSLAGLCEVVRMVHFVSG